MPGEQSWTGTIVLGAEWGFFVGQGGTTPWHSHLAYKLAIGLEHPLTVHTEDAQARTGMIVPVMPGVRHQVVTHPEKVASFYADAGAFPLPAGLTAEEAAALHAVCRQLADSPEPHAGDLPGRIAALQSPQLEARLSEAVRRLSQPLAAATLAVVAAGTGLSLSRFSHRFAEAVGGPPVVYRRWRRLRRAAELLAAGDSIVDAALGAGFSDSAHLTRTFVEMLGITPGVFRANRLILCR